ncbi:hypothetical protein D5S18_02730 [Nocardia panacis]|uniref:Beta-ketoacyl-[acyl-carrier-protein] synthase III N-terminal domain-containing protein n=1 Tax=Nocardia panacis TaxID=2340916 RepID=A0A3A4KSJ8_9NOCA|nr:hypothetical protein [Nocardia panacis]RJO79266.1 hypothetical protein D5S18_02730 [Nocardia panacis]
MPVSIVASAVVREPEAAGSIDRATLAVRRCLAAADLAPDAVDLLINTGVYRDDNLMEPAIAALVQKKTEINLSYTGQPAPALSFDLMNGPCGFLDAIEVLETNFGAAGRGSDVMAAERGSGINAAGRGSGINAAGRGTGVIVSGDGHPARVTPTDVYFPYQATAAAVLVRPSADGGFGRVHRARSVAPQKPIGYIPLTAMGGRGRGTVVVTPPEQAALERGLEIAIDVTRRCLDAEGLDPAAVTLLAADPCPGFAESVATALGIDRLHIPLTEGNPHTAALPFAYRAWLDAAEPTGQALFLGADGHSVASCAAYRFA